MQLNSLAESLVANLGSVDRIPLGEGRTFIVGRWPLAVFRARDGKVYATQALCPHRRGPLADGTIGGTTLVCPLHGLKFDLHTGSALGHSCGAIQTYPVEINQAGEVLVTLST